MDLSKLCDGVEAAIEAAAPNQLEKLSYVLGCLSQAAGHRQAAARARRRPKGPFLAEAQRKLRLAREAGEG